MKIVFFFLVLLCCGCINMGRLNDRIYEAQKQAVLQSPYKSARGALGYVEVQKSYRLNIIRYVPLLTYVVA